MWSRFSRPLAGVKQVTLAAFLALLAPATAIGSLLFWSAMRTDQLEFERQGRLVDQVIWGSALKWATASEAHTTWDHANAMLRRPVLDLDFMDSTFGTYLYKSPGVEETYLLDNEDKLLYSMHEGYRVPGTYFASASPALLPLVKALRLKTLSPEKHLVNTAITPSVLDYAFIHGRAAIVTVKAVTPVGLLIPGKKDLALTPGAKPKPGTEYIFIAVKRMDHNSLLLSRLREDHIYEQVRYSRTNDAHSGEGAHHIRSPWSGRVVGYYLWKPFKPGSAVLKDMILPLLLSLATVAALILFLIRRVRRSTAELQASEAEAVRLALHDVLTGLPNRALFNDRLERALAGSRAHSGNIALLYLDVDRFKWVNDTLGHPAGDELIRGIAARLSSAVRETDTVARLGGDEFAILQTDVGLTDDLHKLCQRLLEAMKEPFDLLGSNVFVGISIGVARGGADGLDRTELTRKADIALYHAKGAGRGRYSVFAESMDATIRARQTVESDLRLALKSGNQLLLHFQPQYDAKTNAVAGLEALVRWMHPTKGLIAPAMFVPIAEECGLIEQLGQWVLTEACTAARGWPIGTMSVNVSAVQLRNPAFPAQVAATLAAVGLQAERLELEITETAFVAQIGQCETNMKALRAMGVRVALDDFGTGYSSFSHLRDFAVDRVKIDRSFIAGIELTTNEGAIIQAIVNLARASGLKITAEGVETRAQRDFLRSAGCDELQGFLLSRPLVRSDVDRLLRVRPVLRAGLRAA